MRLIDVIRNRTDDSESSIIDCYCPSDYGPEYGKYETCEGKTCKECWEQEFPAEGGQTQ